MEVSTNLGRVSLVPRGPYDPAEVYSRLDIVGYEGSSYLVLADGVTGVTPQAGAVYMQCHFLQAKDIQTPHSTPWPPLAC